MLKQNNGGSINAEDEMVLVRLVRGGGRGEGGAMHVYHIVRQANAACIFYFRYASARRSGNNELPCFCFFLWGGGGVGKDENIIRKSVYQVSYGDL